MGVTAAYNLTEIQDMQKRIQEINNLRNNLADERDYYQKIIHKKAIAARIKDYDKYIGKCFLVKKQSMKDKHKDIKALKVLGWDGESEVFFRCAVFHSSDFDKSIEITRFPLMGPVIHRMTWTPESDELKWIDVCKEITAAEFDEIVDKFLKEAGL